MSEQYSFIYNWKLKASLEDVWNAIHNTLEWPEWWKGVKSVVEIQKNDANGINGIRRYLWKSFLPYQLSFSMQLTENEPHKRLKRIAFGELEGTGEWIFTQHNGIVDIQFNWNIVTNKKLMNTFALFIKACLQA